jgi:hypothetical protein
VDKTASKGSGSSDKIQIEKGDTVNRFSIALLTDDDAQQLVEKFKGR